MQHMLANPPVARAEFDSNPVFNVVIAYEDFETGKQAKRTYDYLVAHLGNDCEFNNQMWKFDILSMPKLCDLAAADAAAADIVVISCHGLDFPPSVRTWIESWASGENRPLALVALFDGPKEEAHKTRAVRQYLSAVAERAGMEFFAQPDEWPGRSGPSEGTLFNRDFKPDEPALSRLASVVNQGAAPAQWRAAD